MTQMQALPRLTGTELRLIEQLAYLIERQRQRRPGGTPYALPGRAWLAARLGTCVTTISRASGRLARRGMLHVVQRRPRHGQYQTCLYQIIDASGWAAARLARAARRAFDRVADMTHKRRCSNNSFGNNESRDARPPLESGGTPHQVPPPLVDLSRLPPRLRAVLARHVVQTDSASK